MLKNSHAAVIVETRNIPDLNKTILKHMRMLDNRWELYIFHHFNLSLFAGLKATKINLHKNLDKYSYSNLLATEGFWSQIPHEKILIFQHDSMLLRRGIDKFLEWDWIGAPSGTVFNGGLSLRSRAKMIEVIKSHRYTGEPEDIYFHRGIQKIGGKIPSVDVAHTFACERHFRLNTLGYHDIARYMSQEQVKLINKQYFRQITFL